MLLALAAAGNLAALAYAVDTGCPWWAILWIGGLFVAAASAVLVMYEGHRTPSGRRSPW